MTAWSHGYVADSPYTFSYQPAQTPGHLGMACALAGVQWQPTPRMSVIDLGCGRGLTASVLAAANPDWTVVGLDYNPAHIAEAQELADAAGLSNAGFAEADLAEMTDAEIDQLPEADLITLHGVWTWVSDDVRHGILRVLSRRLKPGGLCYIGYNVMPNFGVDAGMQRLLRHFAALEQGGSSRARIEAALPRLRELAATNPPQLRKSPILEWLLDANRPIDTAYLTHEFMTDHWRPAFHEDVCAALGTAKLQYVGSATLHENIPDMLFQEEQRAAYEAMPPGPAREFMKDLCLVRGFRRDIYIRGLRPTDRTEALDRLVVAACRSLPEEPPKLGVPLGAAELPPEMYATIAEALRQGPQSIGRLRSLCAPRSPNPAELLTLLQGTGLVLPALREGGDAARARRFNEALFALTWRSGDRDGQVALASPVAAGGLPCTWVELALAALPDGTGENAAAPLALAERLGPDLPAEDQARAAELIGRIQAERPAIWRRFGVLAG